MEMKLPGQKRSQCAVINTSALSLSIHELLGKGTCVFKNFCNSHIL